MRSAYWRDTVLGKYYPPNQDLFWPNQDIFNTLFEWEKEFDVEVIRQDESLRLIQPYPSKLSESDEKFT